MFFEGGQPLAQSQHEMREILAFIKLKNVEDVRMVAAALKTAGDRYYEVFLDWAKPFGRYKAKQHWERVRPDPDALIEAAERQIAGATRRDRFKPRTASELQSMSPPPWRIKGVFPAEGFAVVYGASGSAKSFWCIEGVAAIGEGRPFFSHLTRPAPVLYVALEGEAGYRGRTLAWERHHGRPFPAEVRFSLEPFSLIEPQDVTDLAAICPRNPVIVIDTLNRAAPGADENSSKDMGAIIEGAKSLQRLTAGLVILVAHSGKDADKGLRGHSSLFAALDAAVLVERSGEVRTWRVEKSKDGQDGAVHGFHLKTIAVGTDADGDELTSAVIVPEELPSPHIVRPLPQSCKDALAAFHEAANKHGVIGAGGEFVGVPLEAWRVGFYRKSAAENADAKRKAFNRARGELVERGIIAVDNDHYRLAGENAAVGNSLIAACLQRDAGHSGTLA